MEKDYQKLFIEKSKKIHGDKYDYSEVIYVSAKAKVKIKCKKHGYFYQDPSSHSQGKGCRLCRGEDNRKRFALSLEEFIIKARAIHGNTYNYDSVLYINKNTKIIINCLIHGLFVIIPHNHLNGRGCQQCKKQEQKSRRIEYIKTLQNKFIEKSKIIHNNKYSYEKVKYIHSQTNVTIWCPIHGEFEQRPGDHQRGNGCLKCFREQFYSKNERYCVNSLKEKFPQFEIIPNDRQILKGMSPKGYDLEIDIVIRNSGVDLLYVEWNGVFWHSGEYAKIKDKIKKEILKDKLLVIEDLGRFDEDFVKKVINEQIVPIIEGGNQLNG